MACINAINTKAAIRPKTIYRRISDNSKKDNCVVSSVSIIVLTVKGILYYFILMHLLDFVFNNCMEKSTF